MFFKNEEGQKAQARYGIRIGRISLSEPTFSKEYIDATTAHVISEKVHEVAKRFHGMGTTAEMATNTALMLNKENIKKEIVAFESPDVAQVAGAALAALARTIENR